MLKDYLVEIFTAMSNKSKTSKCDLGSSWLAR